MKKLGLIGYPLGHSFSKKYYTEKFAKEHIKDIDYDLYPIVDIGNFPDLFANDSSFYGFNVTIPYKQSVVSFLNELSEEAQEMDAVNCITIKYNDGTVHLKGYNTDAYGFENSIRPLLALHHTRALVLGNGGAAKAVFYSLKKLGISYKIVSRSHTNGDITYSELNKEIMDSHPIIINCSPLGTFPNIDEAPDIPYEFIGKQHLLYDLIYNPEETLFLRRGKENGAMIKNGYEMLLLQAERNWEIWNAKD
ncbi:shikimate dehydrogenase family protein [Sphingobacterium psychroaquaticum]|uniref:Shikimate dehydrogenase n=1 Tax=Sphingobacterium psychroaquaticum TaxID=561061 RepID=A0A1X7KX42_9SPHI|nr:shikimate dehydrogenase [Sphingobacterium psychroaquaticum]SMG46126.1 shikimate dehydrogenase [Sphingobacterium psychroaquaticum]